jgi:glycosyltransferase involved in cell wall biosynthesis
MLASTPRVRWLDYVPASDLPALYGGARLAVFPSLYEGFGFPALEAQACGVPLVCSNAASLPEVAGEGALYFEPRDTAMLADALAMGLADQSLRAALVERGHENVRRFSWRETARQVLEIVTHL